MSSVTLYSIPGSPFLGSVILALEEGKAHYEVVPWSSGFLRSEAHLAMHPFGKMPVFEHDGFRLYETQAIMRYVDAVVPGPRLQPEEPRAAARMNQLIGITDWYVMPQVSAPITRNRVVAPRFNRPVDEDAIVRAIPNASICIAEIGRLLDDHTWLAGDALSLADLLLAPQLSMFAQAPEGAQILHEHENLNRWLTRIEARPSMQATTWDRLLERVAAAA